MFKMGLIDLITSNKNKNEKVGYISAIKFIDLLNIWEKKGFLNIFKRKPKVFYLNRETDRGYEHELIYRGNIYKTLTELKISNSNTLTCLI